MSSSLGYSAVTQKQDRADSFTCNRLRHGAGLAFMARKDGEKAILQVAVDPPPDGAGWLQLSTQAFSISSLAPCQHARHPQPPCPGLIPPYCQERSRAETHCVKASED